MDILKELGIGDVNSGAYDGQWLETSGDLLESRSPATGEVIAKVRQATAEDYERCVAAAHAAFLTLRDMPAPHRGEVVRKVGNAIREKKDALGRLIALEMGKIVQEGWGEVQEVIDIADRALYVAKRHGPNMWAGIFGTERTEETPAEDLLVMIMERPELLGAEGSIRLVTSRPTPTQAQLRTATSNRQRAS